jgi:hypothetical protein
VGRKDHQIKLRGVRIELEEIEAALSEHQKVQQVVMALREDDVGEKHLVAYIVMKAGGNRIEERALRSFLKERLPDPMVPAMFVFLEELPLLPNGKVDRKQLPQPLVGKTQGEARPLNEIEQVLAGIYAALLKREHVEPDASFFEMGGHSLLAAQLASRIRSLFRPLARMPTGHSTWRFWRRVSTKSSGATKFCGPAFPFAMERLSAKLRLR